ncbi:MAG: dephospho-CoA kinase [Crocinitomicaceae bacterium]|nr:dephospho-CoA kinase [Crocinitomicaceae bacterium]
MRIIGLTGGIGSGKSTVAQVFESLGIPVFYADDVAKNIYEKRPEILKGVIAVVGEDIITGGKLDRKKLAEKVFSDAESLRKLNALIHPAVAEEWQQWRTAHKQYPYLMREAAILIESGAYKDCDEIILVTAPTELRIERVMKRDGTDREEILRRMNQQWSDEERVPFATHIWQNDGKSPLLIQILEAHHQWTK